MAQPVTAAVEVPVPVRARSLVDALFGRRVVQVLFLVGLAVLWEGVYRLRLVNPVLFPSFLDVLRSFWENLPELVWRTGVTFQYIFYGMAIAVVLSFVLSLAALRSPTFATVTEMLLAVMHPMPSVALLPLLIIWFGLGPFSLILVILNSALWPMLLNCYTGMRTVHRTYMEVGRNIGLRGVRLIWSVMLPSALSYLITGFAISVARSWRAAIAVEMVFGGSTTSGGIGWYIYYAHYFIEMQQVVAGIILVVIMGVLVERVLLENLERYTVVRWGMLRRAEALAG
ncbi:MAG: ABC transporter permease [Candidatus Methylomirabilales bacterium]